MKVLIQRISSGEFLKTAEDWVEHKSAAQVFCNSKAAIDFCLSWNMRDVALLLVFDSGSDLLLTPFSSDGLGETIGKRLKENSTLQEESRALIAAVDGAISGSKEGH